MDTRICKVCGIEKPFIKGQWVINRGKPTGKVCAACHKSKWAAWHVENCKRIKLDQILCGIQKARSRQCMANKRATKSGLAQLSLANKVWYYTHRQEAIIKETARQLTKKQRVPKWLTTADIRKIKDFYLQAKILTQNTGIKYHVDHIIPLQGTTVSGLHVPNNLDIIPAIDNMRKGNKYANI